jgi:RNA polymerase sigma-70 factor (ECF subfamily)
MNGPAVTDQDVIRMVRNGNVAAFGTLVERYHERIFNATCRLVGYEDAVDLTQDIFFKAYRGLGSFKAEAAFSTWLYRIMLNAVTSHRRKAARSRNVFSYNALEGDENGHNPIEPSAEDPPPPDEVVRKEKIRAVREAIDELEDGEKEMIVLRDIEQRSYSELVEILGVPLGTVKSRLFRARQSLKERLSDYIATPADVGN